MSAGRHRLRRLRVRPRGDATGRCSSSTGHPMTPAGQARWTRGPSALKPPGCGSRRRLLWTREAAVPAVRQVRPGLRRNPWGALRLPAEVRGRQPLLRLDDRPRSTTGGAPSRHGEPLHAQPSAGGAGRGRRGRRPFSSASPRGPHQAASAGGQAATRAGGPWRGERRQPEPLKVMVAVLS